MTRYDMLARIASQRVLWASWSRVAAGSAIAGTDGITAAEFARSLGPRLAKLSRLLTAGRYQPQPLRPMVALRGTKARVRAVPTVCDRIVQRAFLTVCAPALSDRVEASYAYRPGRSWLDAVARAQQHRDAGLRWLLRTDIDDFFATIDHAELARSIATRIADPSVVDLVNGWVAAPLLTAGGLTARPRGLPEGAPVSPLLAELYLAEVDAKIHHRYGQLVRYADDIAVFCSTMHDARCTRRWRRSAGWSPHWPNVGCGSTPRKPTSPASPTDSTCSAGTSRTSGPGPSPLRPQH
ncbi:MAG: RNA-directed polymerase [Actinoplanes sp.]|nr:RNA-directed polymerase [Actinoplanes sp.]